MQHIAATQSIGLACITAILQLRNLRVCAWLRSTERLRALACSHCAQSTFSIAVTGHKVCTSVTVCVADNSVHGHVGACNGQDRKLEALPVLPLLCGALGGMQYIQSICAQCCDDALHRLQARVANPRHVRYSANIFAKLRPVLQPPSKTLIMRISMCMQTKCFPLCI